MHATSQKCCELGVFYSFLQGVLNSVLDLVCLAHPTVCLFIRGRRLVKNSFVPPYGFDFSVSGVEEPFVHVVVELEADAHLFAGC